MDTVSIRPARPAEAGALTAIAVAAKRYWGYLDHWIDQWMPQLTLTPTYVKEHVVCVAEGHAGLLGFYGLHRHATYWELDHLWVLPAFIRQGVGRRLFDHAAAYVAAREPKVLRMDSDPNAAGFYERIGARQIGTVSAAIDGVPRELPRFEFSVASGDAHQAAF